MSQVIGDPQFFSNGKTCSFISAAKEKGAQKHKNPMGRMQQVQAVCVWKFSRGRGRVTQVHE